MQNATQILPGTIMSAGYDWITAYAGGSGSRSRFLDIADRLVADERKAAQGECAASRFGFDGYRGEHWFFGSRKDGVLLVLSADRAVLAGTETIRAATNVSRLDVQVTYALESPEVDIALNAFNQLQSEVPMRGRPPSFTLINAKPKGQTLNVNKRTTDAYGRIYDKGAESGLCPPGQLWRWELELKRHRAHRCALASVEFSNLATYSTRCVAAFFRSKGLEPVWSNTISDLASQLTFAAVKPDPLVWFRSIVSQSVRRAVNRHGIQNVVEALGMDQLVQVR